MSDRRLLLRGWERLSHRAFTRLWNDAVDHDPSGELLAAWIGKEELRGLLGCAARGGSHGDIATTSTGSSPGAPAPTFPRSPP